MKRVILYGIDNHMHYDYTCTCCDEIWEESQLLNDRNLPLSNPCPFCGIKAVKRGIFNAPAMSYAGSKTVLQRAGSGWNDVLTGIAKGSGRQNTIQTR